MQPIKFICLLFCRLWIIAMLLGAALGKLNVISQIEHKEGQLGMILKTKDSDTEKNLKWLPLSMRRDMHTINLTFKCLKGSPSVFFKDYFKVFRTVHNTRGSGPNLLLPKVRTETARKSSQFNESKLFNNIASKIKDSKSVVIF